MTSNRGHNADTDATGDYLRFFGDPQPDGTIEFYVYREDISGEFLQFQLVQTCDRAGYPVTFANRWQKARIPKDE